MIDCINRKDFKKFIKTCSFWKIDLRKGNYKLPNGSWLLEYVEDMVDDFCFDNKLCIAENGHLYHTEKTDFGFKIVKPFAKDEFTSIMEQYDRAFSIAKEIIYQKI